MESRKNDLRGTDRLSLLGLYISFMLMNISIKNTSADLCSDTCYFNNDGECDDGGPGALYAACGFGTDCSDCGTRPPTCGEELLIPDGEGVNVTSPNWPDPYPLSTYCLWKVAAFSAEKRLVVVTYSFETEISHDYLSMGNGLDYTDPQSIVVHHAGNTLPEFFISSGQNVWLTFIVDQNAENFNKGFVIELKEYKGNDSSTDSLVVEEGSLCENTCPSGLPIMPFDGICQDVGEGGKDFVFGPFSYRCNLGTDCNDCGPRTPNCGGVIDVLGKNDVNVSSPNFPDDYNDHDYCHWLIRSSGGRRIDMTFLFFHTESGFDRVSLGNGLNSKDEESIILNQISGTLDSGTLNYVSCPGDGAWMNFIVDHALSDYIGIFTHFSEHNECRPGHSYGNRCYYVQHKMMRNFNDAITFCESMCASLITSFDSVERDFLRDLLKSDEYKDISYWVGAHDSDKEDEWEWLDNTPVDSSLWPNGVIPDGGNGRTDCAYMDYFNDFKMDDTSCRTSLGHVCFIDNDEFPQTTTTTKTPKPLTSTPKPLTTAPRTTKPRTTQPPPISTTTRKITHLPIQTTTSTKKVEITTTTPTKKVDTTTPTKKPISLTTQTIATTTKKSISFTTSTSTTQPSTTKFPEQTFTKKQMTTDKKDAQNIGNKAESSAEQLSTGEVSGIVIVGLICGAVILGCFIWIMIKRKRMANSPPRNRDQETIINNEFQNALYAVPEDIVLGCGNAKPSDLGAIGYDNHYYEEPKINNLEISEKTINFEYENKIPQQEEKVKNENLYTELPEKLDLGNSEC